MEYIVHSDQKINWRASGVEKTLERVKTILNLCKYEVAYNRTLGINTEIVDNPVAISKSRVLSDISEQIRLYEPHVMLKRVRIKENEDDFVIEAVVEVA